MRILFIRMDMDMDMKYIRHAINSFMTIFFSLFVGEQRNSTCPDNNDQICQTTHAHTHTLSCTQATTDYDGRLNYSISLLFR